MSNILHAGMVLTGVVLPLAVYIINLVDKIKERP